MGDKNALDRRISGSDWVQPRSEPIRRQPGRADKDETTTWRVALYVILWGTPALYSRLARHPRTARPTSEGWARILSDDGCLSGSEESSQALAMFEIDCPHGEQLNEMETNDMQRKGLHV